LNQTPSAALKGPQRSTKAKKRLVKSFVPSFHAPCCAFSWLTAS
jgi:hypothetical protein